MNRNERTSPVANEEPSSSRRARALLLLLLLLLLIGGGVAVKVFLLDRNGSKPDPQGDNKDKSNTDKPSESVKRQGCSDTDDPKYLEPLEFGDPIEVAFKRDQLDALKDKPIPEIEIYPWQPEGLVAVLGEHRMRGSVLAAHPDGKTLAVSSGDGFIRFGPTETIHENLIVNNPGGVKLMQWSRNGETLAVCGRNNVIYLYDVRDLSKIPAPSTLKPSTGQITSLSFSGDDKYLIGGDNSPNLGIAWVWDLKTREVINKLEHVAAVMDVSFSPVPGDYRALTAGGQTDGKLHLWDALTGKNELATIEFRGPKGKEKTDSSTYVASVEFSPDGKRALSCHSDHAVRVWNMDRFVRDQEVVTLKGPVGIPKATFSLDGKQIATARPTTGIWLWNADDGKQVRQISSTASVHTMLFLGDKERFAYSGSRGYNHNVHVHDVATSREHRPTQGHVAPATSVRLSRGGQVVASGGTDHTLKVWSLEKGHERFSVGVGVLHGLGFHPDDTSIYGYGPQFAVMMLQDVKEGKTRAPTYNKSHSGGILSAEITRDGRYAVTGGYDGTVRMWRLKDGFQVREFDPVPEGGAASVTVTPDMRRAIRTGGSKTRLLHLRCQKIIHEWENPVAWAPFESDGRSLFFGNAAATPTWKITPEKVQGSEPHPVKLSNLSNGHLSDNEKRIVAIQGGIVSVFDCTTGSSLWSWNPPAHFYGVRQAALSSDGGHLMTANGDGTIYIIKMP